MKRLIVVDKALIPVNSFRLRLKDGLRRCKL